ncbi:MAG: metallophosphoesterase [Acutalibacteraceae bacterium]|nr:metallophosphoesterase [Acutalibacteraceae bacterium]
MGRIFFIADLHFYDKNIIHYENRPFNSVEDMNNKIISNWNKVVLDNDFVYIVGDFGAENNEAEILNKLNGTKYLIKGNHDTFSNEYYRNSGFTEVYNLPIILNNFWILSHEPIYVNNNMPYANIFGHIHNSPLYKDYSSHHFCVSAERIDYTPISFEEIQHCVITSSKKE